MQYVQNWEKTKARLKAFWDGEIVDRCCIAAFAPKENSKYKRIPFPTDEKEKIRYWTDGEAVLEREVNHFENTFFGGDAFPQVFLDLGAAGHAGFIKGSRYRFENTVWFSPIFDDIEANDVKFDENSFLYQKTIELAKYYVSMSNGRYFVSMPDISGNADALAHLRGSENLLVDMITEKDWVHRSLDRIQDISLKVHEEIYNIVKENNEGGSSIGWLNTWAPGKHGQMQCDMSVMISPECFQEFIMPELKMQTDWMDRSLYHFDGIEQLRHLPALLSIQKLDAIQWTCVEGQPSPLEYIPYLREIQKAGKKLVIRYNNLAEIEILLEQLSSKGLLIVTRAPSEDEAKRIIKVAEKLTHE